MDSFLVVQSLIFVNGLLLGALILYGLFANSLTKKLSDKKDSLNEQLEGTIKLLDKAHQDVNKAIGFLDTKVSEVSLKVDSIRGKASTTLKSPFSAL